MKYIFTYLFVCLFICMPTVPARSGAEVALEIYFETFFSIELACTVHQPGPCVLCSKSLWLNAFRLKN